MIAPKIKIGDTIGFVVPSNRITDDRKHLLDDAVKFLKEKRFKCVFADNTFSVDKYGVSGGSPQERADDINNMFKNPDVNAIWCVHGGDTANEILDLIDYDAIKKNPKVFMGKSDIDILLLAINKKTGLITFHAPDPKIGRGIDIDIDYSKVWLRKRLLEGEIGDIESTSEWRCLREGKAKGRLIGCNISTILHLIGTEYEPDFDGAILFLETYKYSIRKMICAITQLKQQGVFDRIKGIVVGFNYDFEKSSKLILPEDIIADIAEGLPILKINEFGHYCPNAILPIGAEIELDATNKKITILEKCLE